MVEWRSAVGVICDKRIFTRVKGKFYIIVRLKYYMRANVGSLKSKVFTI